MIHLEGMHRVRANDFPSQPWQKLLQPLTPQWTHPATPFTGKVKHSPQKIEPISTVKNSIKKVQNGLSIKRAKLYKTLPSNFSFKMASNIMISCDFPPPSHYSHYGHGDLQGGHRSPLG